MWIRCESFFTLGVTKMHKYDRALQEPPLCDVFEDPIIRLLMQHDSVSEEDITSLQDVFVSEDG